MLYLHIVGVIVLASILASSTDWLFFDVLVHRYYQAAPEVWRAGSQGRRIVLSQLIGTLACAAMVMLYLSVPHWRVPGRPAALALIVWCAGPLPVVLQQWQWMRIHPAVAAGHAAGWLARLAITALLAAWLLPRFAGT
jgi:hypothetical protein